MATGTVKWFSSEKGFGFIEPDDGGGDVFVRPLDAAKAHLSPADQGHRVTFEEVDGEGGKVSASDIKLKIR